METWIIYGFIAAILITSRDFFTSNYTSKYTVTEHLLYYYVLCGLAMSAYVCYRKVYLKEKVRLIDKEDLKRKCYNNVGLYITWIEKEDKVFSIDYPREWCAGTTAIHLACQEGVDEIYMLGFDLTSYNEPINNIYKGTDNYLSNESKGFNPINWIKQLNTVFDEFIDTKFYWVENRDTRSPKMLKNNVENISYKTLDKICKT